MLYNNGIKKTKYLKKAQYTLIIGKNPHIMLENDYRSMSNLLQVKKFRKFFKSLFSSGVIASIQSPVFCDICPCVGRAKKTGEFTAMAMEFKRNNMLNWQKEHVKL